MNLLLSQPQKLHFSGCESPMSKLQCLFPIQDVEFWQLHEYDEEDEGTAVLHTHE